VGLAVSVMADYPSEIANPVAKDPFKLQARTA
jgi:hypothetical protein